MKKLKTFFLLPVLLITILSNNVIAQPKIYRTSGAETILSKANIRYDNIDVNTNYRFTLFFHAQQMLNLDITRFLGLYTGLGIRNIGFITEDLYQNVGFLNVDSTYPDWNKATKIKRRSYSLGIPLALKIGNLPKEVYIYAGGEYEWMFHYKQKLFIDDQKYKFPEWNSDRVNQWIPSVFVGIQFPNGFNLKVKYYMDDFLNPNFKGIDFGEEVDYSHFQSTRIWYISLSTILSKQKMKKIIKDSSIDKMASL